MSKKNTTRIVTPRGLFAHAWLSKPDSGQRYSNDKFKVTYKVAKDQLGDKTKWKVNKETRAGTYQDFLDELIELHVASGGSKRKKCPIKDGDVELNNKDEPKHPGFMYFTASSKFKPSQRDAKRNEIEDVIFSGDEGKLMISTFEYDDGISFRLNGLQLLVKNASFNTEDDFDEEDGYEADEDEGSGSSSSDEEPDDDDHGEDDEDF